MAIWDDAVRRGEAVLIGPIRQETLSGVRTADAFARLRDALRAFTDEPLLREDFERAAEVMNACMRQGIQGSPTDFLVCAVALRLDVPVLTADRDFARYAGVVPVRTA